MQKITSPEQIRDIANGFRKSRILLTAFELELFTVLDEDKMNSEEVAKKINADSRATDRLMNALCAMGLLIKEKGEFSNTEITSKYLIKGKPDFMGGLYHTNHLWDNWSYLTESVKRGTSASGDQNKKEKEDWVESFIAAMHHRGVLQAKILSTMIDLSNVEKILDIGGGSAAFSMQLVKKKPDIKATVLDLPHVIPLTKKYVEQEDLSHKFEYIEGNYIDKEFGAGYDLILLSAIVHINSYEQNKKVVKKCADALNDNGIIIISDFIMNEERILPSYGAIFSLNMLVGTIDGDTYTEKEIREWLSAAGFSKIERRDTEFNSNLMIGKK